VSCDRDDRPTEQLPVTKEATKAMPEPKDYTPKDKLAEKPRMFRDRRK
jgi:hypothetical protein